MQKRPLEMSLVQFKPRLGPSVVQYTTFPKSALCLLGLEKGGKFTWVGGNGSCRVVADGPSPRTIYTLNRISIPRNIVRLMRVRDGDRLGWYASYDKKKWEVHVCKSTGFRIDASRRPRKCKAAGGTPSRRPICEAVTNGRTTRTGRFYPKLCLPRPVLNILGIPGRGHVRMAGRGRLLKIEHCRAADEGAMEIHSRMHDGSSGRFRSCFNICVPPTMAGHFEMGERIRWYVGSDGGGGWEIRVGAANG